VPATAAAVVVVESSRERLRRLLAPPKRSSGGGLPPAAAVAAALPPRPPSPPTIAGRPLPTAAALRAGPVQALAAASGGGSLSWEGLRGSAGSGGSALLDAVATVAVQRFVTSGGRKPAAAELLRMVGGSPGLCRFLREAPASGLAALGAQAVCLLAAAVARAAPGIALSPASLVPALLALLKRSLSTTLAAPGGRGSEEDEEEDDDDSGAEQAEATAALSAIAALCRADGHAAGAPGIAGLAPLLLSALRARQSAPPLGRAVLACLADVAGASPHPEALVRALVGAGALEELTTALRDAEGDAMAAAAAAAALASLCGASERHRRLAVAAGAVEPLAAALAAPDGTAAELAAAASALAALLLSPAALPPLQSAGVLASAVARLRHPSSRVAAAAAALLGAAARVPAAAEAAVSAGAAAALSRLVSRGDGVSRAAAAAALDALMAARARPVAAPVAAATAALIAVVAAPQGETEEERQQRQKAPKSKEVPSPFVSPWAAAVAQNGDEEMEADETATAAPADVPPWLQPFSSAQMPLRHRSSSSSVAPPARPEAMIPPLVSRLRHATPAVAVAAATTLLPLLLPSAPSAQATAMSAGVLAACCFCLRSTSAELVAVRRRLARRLARPAPAARCGRYALWRPFPAKSCAG